MKSGRGNHQYEDCEEDDVNSKKDNAAAANSKDKNVMRSKHSVTEQRRRSKINERFQKLRDLIPHSDQKRDTASFLSEVIDHVKYLQERVEKYEGSYSSGWTSEPTKLMPWRNSHWRVPSSVGLPQRNNGSGSVPTISGRFEETINNSNMMAMQTNTLDPLQRPGLDSQSEECPVMSQHEDLAVEGGTISISSAYSQGLLNTLTDALQSAGVDLSQASISVQIDLGKRATETSMDHDGPNNGEEAQGKKM